MKNPRSILITGASSGIGAALARAYAAQGIALALTGRNAERLAAVADACRGAGAEVESVVLDIADEAGVRHWIESVDRRHPLDLVVANAGITGGMTGDGIVESLADVQRMMRINFGGVCNTVDPVLPAMRRRGRGQLALMSSLAALRGLPYSPAYCASKAAVMAYGEGLRTALRRDGVEVSVILPGFVETHLSSHVTGPKPLQMSPERAARIIRRGLQRGRPEIAFPSLLHWGTRHLASLLPGVGDRLLGFWRVTIRRYE